MAYSITKKQLSPQPALVVRRRVERSGIANAIGEALGRVGQYVQQNGIGIAGPPFARYPEMEGGLFTIDIGMPKMNRPEQVDRLRRQLETSNYPRFFEMRGADVLWRR